MSDTPEISRCVVCGQPFPPHHPQCTGCGTSRAWQTLIRAMQFAKGQFEQWGREQLIGNASATIAEDCNHLLGEMILAAKENAPLPSELTAFLTNTCWNCRTDSEASQYCPNCGVPLDCPEVSLLHQWIFTCHLIKKYCESGGLPLAQAHASMNDAKSRIAVLRNRLENERQQQAAVSVAEKNTTEKIATPKMAEDVSSFQTPQGASATTSASSTSGHSQASPQSAEKTPVQHRPFLEILLDPRTIQWFLGLGGSLFVLGLVIWLATLGVFKNPLVVAAALGAGNLSVLLGGWAMIRLSRYQTAGRAITLLACLVMPLNLWFYHSHGLIMLEGHLWVAALVCCVLYLASALVLRDHLFVYVLNAGIALTGLLMLADMGKFWEIASPATLLVVLGIICIHLERAFLENEGPFSRRRFGFAFFLSGHTLLGSGLLLVLGAQIAGDWLYKPLFEPRYQRWHMGPPAMVVEQWGQYLALALVLAGAYAYFYSDIIVRRLGVYVYFAVFTLFWAEILVIELITVSITAETIILAMALTALAANLSQPALLRWKQGNASGGNPQEPANTALSLIRAGQPLGLFLSTIPVLLGIVLHLRATYRPLNELWQLPNGELYCVTWTYVVAMFVTAVSCRIGAHLHRHTIPWLSSTYFFGTAAATLTGLAGLISVMGIKTWDEMAPIIMVVPILYMISSRLYRGHTQEMPLVWVAHVSTGVMIAAVLAAAMHLTPEHVVEPQTGARLNLLLAAFFAEAAVFYALAAAFRKHGLCVYLGTAAACGAIWQVLQYWQVSSEYYTIFFAALGLFLLVCYRLAMLEWTGLVKAAFQCANTLMSLSFVAGSFITFSRLATQLSSMHWSTVFLLLALTVMSLLAAWLVQDAAWRRWYVVMTIAEAGLAFIVLNALTRLTFWDKTEIFSIVVGLALLVIGHIGWRREHEQQSDLVSFSLSLGSLLLGLPLTIAVLIHRGSVTPEFSTINEIGMFIAAVLLLATGFTFQLRSTTLTGACMLLIYLLTLTLYINMLENVQTAAIWMTIGGGLLFGSGILLSVYRDRLLTLPDRVRRREGMFRVLSWR